jgi:hypothetical protein
MQNQNQIQKGLRSLFLNLNLYLYLNFHAI